MTKKIERTHKFTAKSVASPHLDKGEYFDAESPLILYVGTRTRSWKIRFKKDGKRQKPTIGHFPAMSLATARNEVKRLMAEIKEDGRDPSAERKARQAAPTVTELWELYSSTRDKAESTIAEEDRRWRTIIEPAIGEERVADVHPADLYDMLHEVRKRGPVEANRLHSLLSVMFKPALAKRWIEAHPLQWIDKPGGTEDARDRILEDDEVRAVWSVLAELRSNPRDLTKLALYTGQRIGELQSMRWADVDLDAGVWTQPTNKTNVVHIVPLSTQAIEILKAREQVSKWVFPSKHNMTRSEAGKATSGHTTSLKEARKRIKRLSSTDDWTHHDLRRTSRTMMATIGIDDELAERIINHSVGSKMQQTYNRHRYTEEKRRALQRLANHIDRIVGREVPKGQLLKMQPAG
ncbi:tyrosine-type recombinase/integrase [Thermodesulfobacteriota bacterium]